MNSYSRKILGRSHRGNNNERQDVPSDFGRSRHASRDCILGDTGVCRGSLWRHAGSIDNLGIPILWRNTARTGIGRLVRQINFGPRRIARSRRGPCRRQCNGDVGLYLGNCHRNHERNGLVGRADLRRVSRGLLILPFR